MKARFLDCRDASEWIELGCQFVLEEPAHTGGADPDAASERPLLRDASGRIYLAGTALKGVLRRGDGAARLFGGDEGQARLIVNDAPLVSGGGAELRDGVAIDAALGIAADKQKYDLELIPAGSVFQASFEVVVPKGGQEAFFAELCAGLEPLSDGLEVGGRTRRGLGRLRRQGDWRVIRYKGSAGLRAWLAAGCAAAPDSWRVAEQSTACLWDFLGCTRPQKIAQDELIIQLELKLHGSLLIRSTVSGSSPAEVAQLTSRAVDGEQSPVISGTSLAGAIRARCLRIAHTLLPEPRAKDLVEGLFGPLNVRAGNASASRLRVGEGRIRGGRTLRHTRVRIDPWTGGAADALLFTAEPVYGGTVSPVLRWRRPPDDERRAMAERALLLLALRDLALGDLNIGGEGASGRGRFGPAGPDGRFGAIGDTELRLTPQGGLAGDFSAELAALSGWSHE